MAHMGAVPYSQFFLKPAFNPPIDPLKQRLESVLKTAPKRCLQPFAEAQFIALDRFIPCNTPYVIPSNGYTPVVHQELQGKHNLTESELCCRSP
jgi:hypothetical protein